MIPMKWLGADSEHSEKSSGTIIVSHKIHVKKIFFFFFPGVTLLTATLALST
jgi:hypothetical protein